MLKVLFITSSASSTGRANVGDRVILAGVRNLIASAFGYYVYQETGRWSRYDGDPDAFDLIVYAGMPQYGVRGAPTSEEKNFQALIDTSKRAVFMNIGGGAIHSLTTRRPMEAARMAFAGGASYYRRQKGRIAYRSVRDRTSQLFFRFLGAPAKLRACPSYYATLGLEPSMSRAGAISVISNQNFVTNSFHGDMQDLVAGLGRMWPDLDLIAHSGTDLGMLADMGVPHLFFRSETALLSYYASIRKLVSMRVHAAIPAWTTGADVVVSGFDNRVGMFDDVGIPIPWVNMVQNSAASVKAQFEHLMNDPARHLPLAERRALIETHLKRATAEVRQAAPELVVKASDTPQVLEGWQSHPPAGMLFRQDDAFRFHRSVDIRTEGPESSDAEIVRVATGERAASSAKAIQLPLTLSPGTFRIREGSTRRTPTAGKEVPFATSGSLFPPAGHLAFRCALERAGAGETGHSVRLRVEQDGRIIGDRRTPLLTTGKTEAVVTFDNPYPAMPLTLRLSTTTPDNLTITSAVIQQA